MRAAWYEKNGKAKDVLKVGDMPDPKPSAGEVRIRIYASGINPGEIKSREGWMGYTIPYPRVIPHNDGAGIVDAVGDGVSKDYVGKRVFCFGAQSYRAFGTAAQFVTLPVTNIMALPDNASFEEGACLGIPGITAHQSVFCDGSVEGRKVFVAGAAGAVGSMATSLAAWGGATVIASVRSEDDVEPAKKSGAKHVFISGSANIETAVKEIAPEGVDRIIEVAFSANIHFDSTIIKQGGVIAAYSSPEAEPKIPFWNLLFNNVSIRFLGSDDFSLQDKVKAAKDLSACLAEKKLHLEISQKFSLDQIIAAHEALEHPSRSGRVVLSVK